MGCRESDMSTEHAYINIRINMVHDDSIDFSHQFWELIHLPLAHSPLTYVSSHLETSHG